MMSKPRIHGNGFVQVDLNDEGTRRLHIWHKDIPRQKVATPVHDHVFDMRSIVILGTLIHTEFKATESENGTHRVFRAEQEEGTQNTILTPDQGIVELEIVQRLILKTDSLYTFPAGVLHTSDHIGLTATVMEKVNAPDGYGRPRVLCQVGEEPDNEFKRDAFEEEAMKYVEWVLEAFDY